jgi:hypothetical protein
MHLAAIIVDIAQTLVNAADYVLITVLFITASTANIQPAGFQAVN